MPKPIHIKDATVKHMHDSERPYPQCIWFRLNVSAEVYGQSVNLEVDFHDLEQLQARLPIAIKNLQDAAAKVQFCPCCGNVKKG